MKAGRRSFPLDRVAITLLVLAALVFAGRHWLRDHPQHNPWAPFAIDDPPGWATAGKLVALRDDPALCRGALGRAGIDYAALPPVGSGQCLRSDRTVIAPDAARGLSLVPRPADATCAVGAGLAVWLRHSVQPAAQRVLGSPVARIEHLGTASCRRIGGGEAGSWSEHTTGNAIDIAAFVLADGRRIVVRSDWSGDGDAATFLRLVRDGACEVFATTLSPDYNAAHADHFHLDQAGRGRGWKACR